MPLHHGLRCETVLFASDHTPPDPEIANCIQQSAIADAGKPERQPSRSRCSSHEHFGASYVPETSCSRVTPGTGSRDWSHIKTQTLRLC